MTDEFTIWKNPREGLSFQTSSKRGRTVAALFARVKEMPNLNIGSAQDKFLIMSNKSFIFTQTYIFRHIYR
jgi:hypothetical protein